MPAEHVFRVQSSPFTCLCVHICVVGIKYYPVLHCTFSLPSTHALSLRFPFPITHSLSSLNTWSHPARQMPSSTLSLLPLHPSLTAISFHPPSRPATSPFFPMQPRPRRTASLVRRYTSPPVWLEARSSSKPNRSPKSTRERCRLHTCLDDSKVVCLA